MGRGRGGGRRKESYIIYSVGGGGGGIKGEGYFLSKSVPCPTLNMERDSVRISVHMCMYTTASNYLCDASTFFGK